MTIKVRLTFIFCVCVNVMAFVRPALAQNNKFINYYTITNKAELEVVDSLYAEALTTYESGFELVPFPFAHDYYNAAVCAVLSKNTDKAFYFLDKLVTKGLEMNDFDSAVFDPLKNEKKWRHFVKTYPSKRKKHLESINTELRQEFELMKEQDQYFRKKEGSYEAYRDTILKTDSINVVKFLRIVEKYGFPDEQMIGTDNIYGVMPYDIVLIHNAQHASRYYHIELRNELSKILLQAVYEGKLSPEAYASLEDNQNENHSYGSMVYIRINGKLEPASPRADDYVNKNRMKLGLGTRDELRRKVLFEDRDKRFHFNNIGGIFTIVGEMKK